MRYEVRVPITGYAVYCVDADSEEDAIEAVFSGDADSEGLTDTEGDIDSNNWCVNVV